MAIRLRNTIWLSSLSTFRKNIRENISSGNKRFIMSSSRRLEKVLEDLQKNPYFDKYAEKIAKFQKTSPDEFLQRIEKEEKKSQEKTAKQEQEYKFYQSQAKPQLDKNDQPRQVELNNIMKVDMVLEKSKEEIIDIWKNYHKHKDCISGVLTPEQFDKMFKYGKQYPTFLLPLPRQHGYEFIVIQFYGTEIHMTPLLWYQAHKENAPECLSMVYYTELKESKEIVLMRGEFDKNCISVQEAQCLANELQLYYSTDNPERLRLLDLFTSKPDEFKHMDLIAQLERIQLENRLDENGHIYLDKYSGWYSVSDEAFISDAELIEQKDKAGNIIRLTANSGSPVEWMEEETYKFRLTSFEDDLRYWLKNENTVQPAIYHKILLSWIEQGLQDLSISRPIDRVPWAIPTPSDKSHTVYVWLDALVNYLTSIGYPDSSFKQFWPPTHIVGKDILKFHGVYWPAFLMAVGLEPPKGLLCHGHWTVDDHKMSKSKGNVISPFDAMLEFTAEGLRYFLLRQAVPHSDANYNARKIQNMLNAELANTFGNLLNRCLGKGINPSRAIPDPSSYVDILRTDVARENIKLLEGIGETAKQYYEEHNLHHVVDAAMSLLHAANQMFNHHRPWRLSQSADSVKELEAVLSLALESVRVAALVLYPIIPRSTSNLLDSLEVPIARRLWRDTTPLHLTNCFDGRQRIVPQNISLFEKIVKN